MTSGGSGLNIFLSYAVLVGWVTSLVQQFNLWLLKQRCPVRRCPNTVMCQHVISAIKAKQVTIGFVFLYTTVDPFLAKEPR